MPSRTLTVKIVGDSRDLERAFGRSERASKKFQQSMTVALGGGGVRGLASRGGVYGAAAFAAGVTVQKTTQLASNLNEEITKSAVVFGDSADEIKAWSNTTAEGFGIAQIEALRAAGNFGQMFSTIGLGKSQAADMSQRLVELASDLASFNNEDPTDMLDRLRSGLAGEAEPLRRFGILLSEARVKQEAYRSGIAKAGAALTEQQKVQARYRLILQDTSLAQGDFARTSDSLANQQRVLKAQTEELATSIGGVLLPVMTEIVSELNTGIQAMEDFGETMDEQGSKAEGFAGFLAGAAGALKDFASAASFARMGRGVRAGAAGGESPFQAPFAVGPRGAPGAMQALRKRLEEEARKARRGTPEQRNRWFDAFVGREIDKSQDLALQQQIDRLRAIAKLIEERINITKDITRKLTLEDQLRAVNRQVQAAMDEQAAQAAADAADAAAKREEAREKAEDRREKERERRRRRRRQEVLRVQAQQFAILGQGPLGGELIPNVGSLQKRFQQLAKVIPGTELDTDETRGRLAQLRRLFAKNWTSMTSDVKSFVDNILDEWGRLLDEQNEDPTRWKWRAGQPPGQSTAFTGRPGAIVINGPMTFNGIQNVRQLEAELARRTRSRPKTRRGAG